MKFGTSASIAALSLAATLLTASGAGAQYYDYRGDPVYRGETMHPQHHRHLSRESRYERARFESERDRMSRNDNPFAQQQSFRKAPGTAYQVPLDQVTNPKATLASANVVDEDGNSVGSVQDIKTGPGGQVEGVRISAGGMMGYGAKTIALPNADLRFEPDRDVLIAGMTRNQIKALPAVQPNTPNTKSEINNPVNNKKG